MDNIFTLHKYENEDSDHHLNIDDLYEKKREKDEEQLKIFRGGELTRTDEKKIKGKTNQQIHDYLIQGEKLILMRSKINGVMQYMLLKDYLAENTLSGNKLDEYLEPVPRNYFSLEKQCKTTFRKKTPTLLYQEIRPNN